MWGKKLSLKKKKNRLNTLPVLVHYIFPGFLWVIFPVFSMELFLKLSHLQITLFQVQKYDVSYECFPKR